MKNSDQATDYMSATNSEFFKVHLYVNAVYRTVSKIVASRNFAKRHICT